MQINNRVLGYVFNALDFPVRMAYTQLGFISKALNAAMFWKLYSSDFTKLDDTFETLFDLLEHNAIPISGKNVLELGPGNSYINAYNFLMRGASKLVLVDKFPRYKNSQKQKEFFTRELEFVKQKYAGRDLFFLNNGIVSDRYVKFIAGDIREISDAGQIDFIYSISVLEHIKDVKDTVKAMTGILHVGGYMHHKIDMRDHYNFSNPFLFLKYSDKIWDTLLTKEGLSYTNRLRYQDYIDIFTENGLEIISEQRYEYPLPNKLKLDRCFASRTDLNIGRVEFTLRKR